MKTYEIGGFVVPKEGESDLTDEQMEDILEELMDSVEKRGGTFSGSYFKKEQGWAEND